MLVSGRPTRDYNPLVDTFLGCDYVDTYDIYGGGDVGNQGFTIGAHIGKPNQEASACEGAQLIVNDSFMSQNGPASVPSNDVWVKDINSIWDNGTVVGYEYLGSDNNKYVQINTGTFLGVSFGVSLGFVGLSITPPSGFSPIRELTKQVIPTYHAKKCFTRGSQLS